jgi:hypothetical protein
VSYGTTTQTCFDAPLTMSIGFSGGRSRPTFRWSSPPNLIRCSAESVFLLQCMSLFPAQVFGRRQPQNFHTLWRPAAEKRQGTKSRRRVVRRQCRGLWGFSREGEGG